MSIGKSTPLMGLLLLLLAIIALAIVFSAGTPHTDDSAGSIVTIARYTAAYLGAFRNCQPNRY